MKCLICHGPHRAADCPTRTSGGAAGNMQLATVEEEEVQCFVSHLQSEESGAMMVASTELAQLTLFVMEDLFGYAIVDTGATKSMAGLSQMEWLQEAVFSELGEDMVQFDHSVITNFTYANGSKGRSLGRCGIPHPLALTSEVGSCLWFTMVDSPSPTLLGLDCLEASDACCRDGALEFPDGHREPLLKLRSGHWGLPLL